MVNCLCGWQGVNGVFSCTNYANENKQPISDVQIMESSTENVLKIVENMIMYKT